MKYQNLLNREIAGYRLVSHIGSGGMGEVYKGHNAALNRDAAVKLLYQKEYAGRFGNEAFIQSSISHHHIAKLYEYVAEGEMPCIIMEYVEGEPLDAYIRRKGRLSNNETEKIVLQIASALEYLHGKDILHRDLKPQNFRIQRDGVVKMLDFGIAKNKYTPKFTKQGFIVGTTEYMAPEQFQEQVQLKSDIWSFGVMMYEMLTGFLPFESNNPLSLRSRITKGSFTNPRVLVPGISEKMAMLIEKCLKVNPSSRISAAEIVQVLEQKDETREPRRIKAQERINGFFSRPWAFLSVLVVSITVLLAISGWPVAQRQSEEPPFNNGPEVVRPITNKNTGALQSVRISIPGIDNARIIFPDGRNFVLPYDIKGKTGELVEFVLQADGYIEKHVQIEISHRRSSYQYHLEKFVK